EQFGENFKQLNEAVGKILVWQEKYREQITEMIQQQQIASQSMTIATERYSDLLSKAEVFTQLSNNLQALLVGLETQHSQIDQAIRSLGTLLVKATESLPQLESKIIDMTKQVGDAVKVNSDEMVR